MFVKFEILTDEFWGKKIKFVCRNFEGKKKEDLRVFD